MIYPFFSSLAWGIAIKQAQLDISWIMIPERDPKTVTLSTEPSHGQPCSLGATCLGKNPESAVSLEHLGTHSEKPLFHQRVFLYQLV